MEFIKQESTEVATGEAEYLTEEELEAKQNRLEEEANNEEYGN